MKLIKSDWTGTTYFIETDEELEIINKFKSLLDTEDEAVLFHNDGSNLVLIGGER